MPKLKEVDHAQREKFERMIDDQEDPISRGVCMILLRMIEDLERAIA